jgi:hypothetical protein
LLTLIAAAPSVPAGADTLSWGKWPNLNNSTQLAKRSNYNRWEKRSVPFSQSDVLNLLGHWDTGTLVSRTIVDQSCSEVIATRPSDFLVLTMRPGIAIKFRAAAGCFSVLFNTFVVYLSESQRSVTQPD